MSLLPSILIIPPHPSVSLWGLACHGTYHAALQSLVDWLMSSKDQAAPRPWIASLCRAVGQNHNLDWWQFLPALQHLTIYNTLQTRSCIGVSRDFSYATVSISQVRKLGFMEESDFTRVSWIWAWVQGHTHSLAPSLSGQSGPPSARHRSGDGGRQHQGPEDVKMKISLALLHHLGEQLWEAVTPEVSSGRDRASPAQHHLTGI